MKDKSKGWSILPYKGLYPALSFIVIFVVLPIIYAVFVSFHKYHYGQLTPGFTAANYLEIFSSPLISPRFYDSLLVTLHLSVVAIPLVVVISLAIALVLDKDYWGNNLIKVSLLVPYAIPASVNSAMWSWLYDANFGFVNYILKTLGITSEYITFLGNTDTALYAIVFAYVWKFVPYTTFMILAGLKQIPENISEAASMDCGSLRSFWYITLPMLKPIMMVVLALQTIFVMTRHFSLVYVLTGGGPAGATQTLAWHIYEASFQSLHFGRGTALALIMSTVMLGFIYFYFMALGSES